MKYTLFFLALTVWAQTPPPSSNASTLRGKQPCSASVTDNCIPARVSGTVYGVTAGTGDVIAGTLSTATAVPKISAADTITESGMLIDVNNDVTGIRNLTITGTLTAGASGAMDLTAIVAPATPAAGIGSVYVDSTSKNLAVKDDAGVVKHGVQTATCTNQFASAISDAGAVTCATVTQATSDAALKRIALGVAVGDPAGSALATGVLGYIVAPKACTIAGWNIIVDAGTATVDVWKVATGTAIPTDTNTITASAVPAIASGTVLKSTTLTGWTTSVAAYDIIGFNLDAVATAKFLNITLFCE